MCGGISFNPAKDIPDLSGMVYLVTGGSNGLGKETIRELAKHNPAKIYLATRSESKATEAIAEIKLSSPNANIEFLALDLTSFASIEKAAETFLAENDRLDVLMNNAGIMATPPGLTKEGYEVQFGTNHIGHALLTKLLLPILESTAAKPGSDVRIVNLSSSGHGLAPETGLTLDEMKSTMEAHSTWERYGQSKLANVYFTKGLAKHHPTIKSVVVHPGAANTGITTGTKNNYPWLSLLVAWASLLFPSAASAARNQIWATTADSSAVGQAVFYYPVGKVHKGNENVNNEKMADSLWDWTEAELKGYGF